jgi:hypothetical protein
MRSWVVFNGDVSVEVMMIMSILLGFFNVIAGIKTTFVAHIIVSGRGFRLVKRLPKLVC